MTSTLIIFVIIILVMSVVIHEVSHGYAAYFQGDSTAKYAGRLTLNPIKHLDLVGSIIVPLICVLIPGGFFIGWAKPVPFNPYNLKHQKYGEALVAIAGPLSNFIIAIVFGFIVRFDTLPLSGPFNQLCIWVVVINVSLALFNLIPIPPLDGSKILFALIPHKYHAFRVAYERYSLILIVAFIFLFSQYLAPVIYFFSHLIVGKPF